MAKSYVNRKLRNGDAAEIERIVRDCAPFVVTPSNIKDGEEYDIELLRKESCNTGVELKALLDNNIFTRIIPLINGKQQGKPLDDSQRKACAIMCFLIYAGIEANPVTALWERPSRSSYTKEEEDFLFRIADHLYPQVFSDLALGRIQFITQEVLAQARNAVVNSLQTMENIRSFNYSAVPEQSYKLIYMGLLKVWCINKIKKNKDQKLRLLLDWMYNQTVSCFEVIGYALNLFADNRSGGIFKKINSDKYDTVISNAKNAAWDILQILMLFMGHQNSDRKTIYFFVTRDNHLLNLPRRVLQIYNNSKELKLFIDSSYPQFKYEGFMKSMDRFGNRADNENHKAIVFNSLNDHIFKLECQVRDILATKSKEIEKLHVKEC